MNTSIRHDMWEINLKGYQYPLVASQVILKFSDGVADHDISRIKRLTAESEIDGTALFTCSECDCPVFIRKSNANSDDEPKMHFVHNRNQAPDIDKMMDCTFYKGVSGTLFSEIYNGEGPWHFETKSKLIQILVDSDKVKPKTVFAEKYIFKRDHDINVRRKPDIQFTDLNNNEWVIELTRWWMSPKIALERERFYKDLGKNLLWLFSPKCSVQNRSTYDLIMFGSNFDDKSIESQTRPQSNAFTISESAIGACLEHKTLMFDVMYPEYHFNSTRKAIEIDYQYDRAEFTDLILSPSVHLPYAIETQASLKKAKALLAQYYRDRLAALVREVRTEYFSVFINADRSEWAKAFTYAQFNSWRLAIRDEYLQLHRVGKILAVMETVYQQEKRKRFRDSLALSIKSLRHYFYKTKQNKKLKAAELPQCLQWEVSSLIPVNYRFKNRIKSMDSHLLQYREMQAHREALAPTINQLRLFVNQIRLDAKNDLSPGTHRIDSLVSSLDSLLSDGTIANHGKTLTKRINTTVVMVKTIQTHRHQLKIEYIEKQNTIKKRNLNRVERECKEVIDELHTDGIKEFPHSGTTLIIKLNRLRSDCRRLGLKYLYNDINQCYETAMGAYGSVVMSATWPLITKGWNETDRFDHELNHLFDYTGQLFHLSTPQHQESYQCQIWTRELLAWFIDDLNEKLSKLYRVNNYPRHDQLIKINRKRGIYAKRLLYIYTTISKRQDNLIDSDSRAKVNWLDDLLKELKRNPTMSRL